MKRAYIIVGLHPIDRIVEDYYAVCHSMVRANELCSEAAKENSFLEYTWFGTTEEDDENG